jgi:predicted aspartyl protease
MELRWVAEVVVGPKTQSLSCGGEMGLFYVRGRLRGPGGLQEEVDLLVDTGATLLTLPKELADRLGVVPTRHQRVVTAGGRREVWPVGEVRLELDGQEVITPCFIAPSGPPLLGAVALESLFLAVDPVAKKLVPVEGFVGTEVLRALAPSSPQLKPEASGVLGPP